MHFPAIVWFILSVILIIGAGIYLVMTALAGPIEQRRRRVISIVGTLAFLLVWLVFFYFILPAIITLMLGRPR